MDLKRAGNVLYQVGTTKNEMGGSHFVLVNELTGGYVPKVDRPGQSDLWCVAPGDSCWTGAQLPRFK